VDRYRCDLTGQCDCDDGDGLCIGSVCYSKDDLLANFARTAAGGNALVQLSHQLIAAKLNILCGGTSDSGTTPDITGNQYNGTSIADLIVIADGLIGSLDINTALVQASTINGQKMSQAAAHLDAYNNGFGGVSHCA
jgi:hypothetical protein